MTAKLGFIYHEDFLKYNFGKGHPLNSVRIQMHKDLLELNSFFNNPDIQLIEAKPCSDEDLLTVHTPDYIDFIRKLSERGEGSVDDKDTPAFKNMFEITKTAVGGTVTAVDEVMHGNIAHAWNPGGGFHHAKRDSGGGFCIFNDIAIAIKRLINRYNVKRILYLDIDAHHGNGVQDIFYDDSRVFKISLHESGETLYPHSGFEEEAGIGDGKGYNINIPLPIGTFDEAYIHIVYELIPLIAEFYDPQFIILAAGADAHFLDPLSHLQLTSSTYIRIAELIHNLSHRFCGGKCIVLGAGGYSLNATPRIWSLIVSRLAGVELKDEIPVEWRSKYTEYFKDDHAPLKLLDDNPPKIDPERYKKISKYVSEITNRVRENVFMLYGFFKLIK
ncbi:MAG: acetoin utilization protein AcuC [Candidatus Odinarchaeum yellowstonii]|uniref:Acetoin utilization protein AcuC n=1 Tax=Odinarchaeota yellowstonii (strain LCB_4) TaxID=1841599 RepID=A0AAF0D2V8_ODILC|nr:MAG: acetoin utilization protein AcuC [Candidatus Odinarchaeum yellowstonii]